jgi:hypothetical protein
MLPQVCDLWPPDVRTTFGAMSDCAQGGDFDGLERGCRRVEAMLKRIEAGKHSRTVRLQIARSRRWKMDEVELRRASLMSLVAGCYRQREFDEGLRLLEALLTDEPGNAEAWHYRGKCLFCLRRYTEAAACFEPLVALGGRCGEDTVVWHAGCLVGSVNTLQSCLAVLNFLTIALP